MILAEMRFIAAFQGEGGRSSTRIPFEIEAHLDRFDPKLNLSDSFVLTYAFGFCTFFLLFFLQIFLFYTLRGGGGGIIYQKLIDNRLYDLSVLL